jgi:hypothetical protein
VLIDPDAPVKDLPRCIHQPKFSLLIVPQFPVFGVIGLQGKCGINFVAQALLPVRFHVSQNF